VHVDDPVEVWEEGREEEEDAAREEQLTRFLQQSLT
jgi:hypothetical protein